MPGFLNWVAPGVRMCVAQVRALDVLHWSGRPWHRTCTGGHSELFRSRSHPLDDKFSQQVILMCRNHWRLIGAAWRWEQPPRKQECGAPANSAKSATGSSSSVRKAASPSKDLLCQAKSRFVARELALGYAAGLWTKELDLPPDLRPDDATSDHVTKTCVLNCRTFALDFLPINNVISVL